MGSDTGILQYLDFFAKAFSTVSGQFVVVALALLFGYIFTSARGQWAGYALLLLSGIASLFENTNTGFGYDLNLSAPTAAFIGMARLVFTSLLCLMTLKLLLRSKSFRRVRLGANVRCLLALQVYFALRMLSGDDAPRAVLSAVMACLLVSAVYAWLIVSLDEPSDIKKVQGTIIAAGVAFIGICVSEYVRNPTSMLAHQRFTGISGNPQFAAIFLAIQCITAFSVMLDQDQTRRRRFLMAISLVMFASFLVWTGSRTGMLMVFVGIMVLNRVRLSRWVLVLVALTVALVLGFILFPAAMENVYRVTDSTNTRAEGYTAAWETFLANPAYGDPNFGVVENSYLTVAASSGLFGVALLVMFLVTQIRELIRAYRLSKLVPEIQSASNYMMAMTVALAVGSMFEGFLLGFATASIIFVFMTLALTRFVNDYCQERPAHDETAPEFQFQSVFPDAAEM